MFSRFGRGCRQDALSTRCCRHGGADRACWQSQERRPDAGCTRKVGYSMEKARARGRGKNSADALLTSSATMIITEQASLPHATCRMRLYWSSKSSKSANTISRTSSWCPLSRQLFYCKYCCYGHTNVDCEPIFPPSRAVLFALAPRCNALRGDAMQFGRRKRRGGEFSSRLESLDFQIRVRCPDRQASGEHCASIYLFRLFRTVQLSSEKAAPSRSLSAEELI